MAKKRRSNKNINVKDNSIYLLAIVAIIAVVGIVIMVSNGNCGVSDTLTEGVVDIGDGVDIGNDVEGDLAGEARGVVNIRSNPDLVPLEPYYLSNKNNVFTLRVDIKNQGNIKTSAGAKLYVLLLAQSGKYYGPMEYIIPAIKPGQKHGIETQSVGPIKAWVIMADKTNIIQESNEMNNYLTGEFAVK